MRHVTATREFTSDDKHACRRFNVAVLDDPRCLHLADPSLRLWLDWVELAGENNPTVDLLAPVLGPGRFVGVDRDAGCVDRNAARGLPHATWVHGQLQTLLANRPALFARAGVLNYDSFAGWNGDSILVETAPLVRFARQQLDRVGEFVLIVNAAMVRNVPRHVAEARARRVFTPLLAPFGRDLEPTDLFYYRADGDRNDMLNVRVQVGFQ